MWHSFRCLNELSIVRTTLAPGTPVPVTSVLHVPFVLICARSTAKELRSQLDNWLATAGEPGGGPVRAIIAP